MFARYSGANEYQGAIENLQEFKRPGGGGDSHIKVTRVIVGNFEKTPKRYQNSVLWAWSEQFFTPKRYSL